MISCAVIGAFYNQMSFETETLKVSLELDVSVIAKLEEATGTNLKSLLEAELSVQNVDVFIEKMGYDNW